MALEFPEMYLIRDQMNATIRGKQITRVSIANPKAKIFDWKFSNLDKVDISGERIDQIDQHGDQLHLRMGERVLMFGDFIGKLVYVPAGQPLPDKAQISFHLDDDAAFYYQVSLYGFGSVISQTEAAARAKEAGISPLSDQFTAKYLEKAFAEPKRKIAKQMNVYGIEYKAGGLGNGYWHEVLYLSGVLPTRKSNTLTDADFEALHRNTGVVIREAMEQHGSADEVDFWGKPGLYLRKIGRRNKGQPCPRCGGTIEVKNLLGSNSYFCRGCQH